LNLLASWASPAASSFNPKPQAAAVSGRQFALKQPSPAAQG
jgi:hypothetical protein